MLDSRDWSEVFDYVSAFLLINRDLGWIHRVKTKLFNFHEEMEG